MKATSDVTEKRGFLSGNRIDEIIFLFVMIGYFIGADLHVAI